MATMAFNKFFKQAMTEWWNATVDQLESADPKNDFEYQVADKLLTTYANALNKGAMFDARCFNIPKEEVTNLIYWRQLDAVRNSIQMVGQANFPHNQLQNKTCDIIQDMLMTEKGINWNDFPTYQKRGSCCIRKEVIVDMKDKVSDEILLQVTTRPKWIIDTEIPMFKGEDRKYIDKLIYLKEEK
jgi:tRNA(His) 5'-end guanylyltransferase